MEVELSAKCDTLMVEERFVFWPPTTLATSAVMFENIRTCFDEQSEHSTGCSSLTYTLLDCLLSWENDTHLLEPILCANPSMYYQLSFDAVRTS